jgi:hypothetical protein
MHRSKADSPPLAFGPAHTWCDAECGRCTLEPECPLARTLRGSRWLDELAAEPSQGWDAVAAHVDDTPLQRPTSGFAERLRAAGTEYAVATSELLLPLLPHGELEHAHSAGLRVGAKVGRLAAMLTADEQPRFEPSSAWNAFATLMLIERLDGFCSRRVRDHFFPRAPRPLRRFTLARARLWAILLRLLRKIPSSARRALRRLVASGHAPSPFLIAAPAPRMLSAQTG